MPNNTLDYRDAYYTSIDRLSQRSKNVLQQLGGVKAMLEHFQWCGTFANLPGSGIKTDVELCSFSYNLLNNIANKDAITTDDVTDSISDTKLVSQYEFLKTKLTTRSKNIIRALEVSCRYDESTASKVTFIKDSILSPFEFIRFRNLGKKSEDEINQLAFTLRNYVANPADSSFETADNELFENIDLPITTENADELLVIKYEQLKKRLSVRAINGLKSFENSVGYYDNEALKVPLIKHIFLHPFDFKTIRNLGAKSETELQELGVLLRNFVFDLKSNNVTPVVENVPLQKLMLFFNNKIGIEEASQLMEDEAINIPQLFLYNTLFTFKSGAKQALLASYYFNNENPQLEDCVVKIDYSYERLRQVKEYFEEEGFSAVWQSLSTFFTSEVEEWYQSFSDKKTIEPQLSEPSLKFLGINYEASQMIQQLFFEVALNDRFLNIDKLIYPKSRKSFIAVDNQILLANTFIQDTKLDQLISWLDNEIYAFECDEFSYDLEILVKRFYDEQELEISRVLLSNVIPLVELAIKKDWSDISEIIERNRKRRKRDEMYNLVETYIIACEKPQKTDAILEYLHQNYIDITTERLLYLLNKNKSVFKQVGMGYWALINQLESSEIVGGTIRDIVFNMLDTSASPLHFSEIIKSISNLRHVEERSLISNLKVDEHKRFRFFNCGFIGLSNKVYDNYFEALPRLVASKVTNLYIVAKDAPNMLESEINYLQERFGYPSIHLRYLVEAHLANNY